MTGPAPLAPLPVDVVPNPRRELFATLARIDGWGVRAWHEIMGAWRLRSGVILLDDVEREDGDIASLLILDGHRLGRHDGSAAATVCDWVLRRTWSGLIPRAAIKLATHQPEAAVRATNACFFTPGADRQPPALCLRLILRLPMAGMCCDGKRLGRFLRQLEDFAADLCVRRTRADLAAALRAVAVQEALRAALPAHGLVAFLGDGARIARGADGGAAPRCRPLRPPRRLLATIDLGPLGRHRGLGIRRGVTALTGAPYHGKSTLLHAIAAGRDNHLPGDGRERVVADPSALAVVAEEGRRIKNQDVAGFFDKLPGADPRRFSTERASGATSMAASVLQGIAAGSRLLLIDEDSAASNFLSIDAGMRALLGRSARDPLRGVTTLLEALPALARAGISTVLVAGSSLQTVAAAQRVLLLEHFQPSDATARAKRLLAGGVFGRERRRPAGTLAARAGNNERPFTVPTRVIADEADCLLGPRHFLTVDVDEPERPRIAGVPLDLRRSGWDLDPALSRGACCAAAWACRLAGGAAVDLAELGRRYAAFVNARGVRGFDPFDSAILALPPWPLVVTVLERLPRPRLRCRR